LIENALIRKTGKKVGGVFFITLTTSKTKSSYFNHNFVRCFDHPSVSLYENYSTTSLITVP